jgi:arginine-tRNA-protein transferase
MYPATPEQFEAFLKTGTDNTLFYKFYRGDKLLAVSVMDVLQQGMSAVYTFFDPKYDKRSLGNFVILWQIRKVAEMELDHLFLGYWIKGCAKMQYKSSFRPIELLIEGKWVLLN